MGIKISVITTITRLSSKVVVMKMDYKSLDRAPTTFRE